VKGQKKKLAGGSGKKKEKIRYKNPLPMGEKSRFCRKKKGRRNACDSTREKGKTHRFLGRGGCRRKGGRPRVVRKKKKEKKEDSGVGILPSTRKKMDLKEN